MPLEPCGGLQPQLPRGCFGDAQAERKDPVLGHGITIGAIIVHAAEDRRDFALGIQAQQPDAARDNRGIRRTRGNPTGHRQFGVLADGIHRG